MRDDDSPITNQVDADNWYKDAWDSLRRDAIAEFGRSEFDEGHYRGCIKALNETREGLDFAKGIIWKHQYKPLIPIVHTDNHVWFPKSHQVAAAQ